MLSNFEYNLKKQGKLFPFLFLCLIVLLIYIPSFTGEFILDDNPLVLSNQYFREWHPISSYMFQEDGYDKDTGAHTGYYRPLLSLSYTLDYKTWGLIGPGFRITNLILHLLVCFSLFVFYKLILKKINISLLLALLFAVHPVNTETVSWIAARNNLFVTLFGILSLYYYIKYKNIQKNYTYIFSLIFYVLAIFSKEFGLMLLPMFFLYQRILNSNGRIKLLKEAMEYLPYIIMTVFYFILRQNTIGSLVTPVEYTDIYTRIFNLPYVLLLNLRLIFLPFELHSFIIKYPKDILNSATLLSILLLFLLIYMVWRYFKSRIIFFSISTFFLALFPVLGIIPTSAPSLIAMRWLYFPLLFILLLISIPLSYLLKLRRTITVCFFSAITIYLSINSLILNMYLWHSGESFFNQEVLNFKNMFYADGLGHILSNKKEYAFAKKYFEYNFDSEVHRANNYLEYAHILLETGAPNKTLDVLTKGAPYCTSDDELGRLFYIKGLVYLNINELKKAQKNLKKATIFAPKEPVYWENLGVVTGMLGDNSGAINFFKKALRIGILSDSIQRNLAFAYISINECDKALSIIRRYKKEDGDLVMNRMLEDANNCRNKKENVIE